MNGPALLLDGHSLLYRAFYALPPMSTTTGVATGGLYGLSVLLLKLLREEQPRAVSFALDLPGPTVRHERYAAYKAGRPPTPDPLRSQLARLPELAAALGAPVHRVPGWEADDVLGTLCGLVEPALVVSGDTDLLQLAGPQTTVLFVGRRQKDHVRYSPETVLGRYGFEPRKIPTYKALVGDSSDNLPGVAGIGSKTAAKLIAAHGDAAGILSAAAQQTPKVRGALQTHGAALLENEALATVRRDLPLVSPHASPFLDKDPLREFFKALEFKSLVARLDALTLQTEVVGG